MFAGVAQGATNPAQGALSTWTARHPGTGAAVWRLTPGGRPVMVAEYRPDAPQLPASVMKLVTGSGAILALGPDFRFSTTIATSAASTTAGGVLRGTLYLTGSGDPVLSTAPYATRYLGTRGVFTTLPARLAASGVRLVRGPIVADESILDSVRTGPQWRAYYTAYSPPLSGLSVNQNYEGALRARYVADPPRAAAARLRAALRANGVRQVGALRTGRTPTSAVVVGRVSSPPLRTILRVMNLQSDNFIAETLRKDVGAHAGAAGTSTEGAAVTVRLLEQRGVLSPADRVVDGSGLSRANRLTAGTLVRLLAAADADPVWGPALIGSLARGGEGTLIRRFLRADIRRRVHAKTGYIDGVSALAGVADSPGGVRYAFAFLMNDWDIAGARATQDRIVTALAAGRLDAATATAAQRQSQP